MYLLDRVCVCVWALDWFLRLGHYNTKSGPRQKQRGNWSSSSSCLFLSICWLRGRGVGGRPHCVFFPKRRLLWAHIPHSLVIRSQAWLSPLVLLNLIAFDTVTVLTSVHLSRIPFPPKANLLLSVCLPSFLHHKSHWWFCPSGWPFSLLAQAPSHSFFHSKIWQINTFYIPGMSHCCHFSSLYHGYVMFTVSIIHQDLFSCPLISIIT